MNFGKTFDGDPKKTATLGDNLDNTAYEAAAEHPPALKVSIGMIEIVVGMATNVTQVATSTIAWMSMILHNPSASLTSASGVDTHFNWVAVVALGIAAIVQATLHMQGQAISSTWARLRHIQNFNIKSAHALQDVGSTVTFRTIFGIFALITDIVSDSTFINLLTHNPLVIGAWIVALTGGSTLLLYDGATRVWGAIEDYKDYQAYHAKYDPKERSK